MTTTLERIDKARRLLIEGRLIVTYVDDLDFIQATCRGDSGEVYELGYGSYEGTTDWYCTCPARTTCAHLKALMLVTVRRG